MTAVPTRTVTRRTPFGHLLCRAVPIARTGIMVYGAAELPGMIPDGRGLITIRRPPAQVFAPAALASFRGVPLRLGHPQPGRPAPVVGRVGHVRRGRGAQADLLLADLIVTDHAAIRQVLAGLRQVSCGYDARYRQLAPGSGEQSEIRGDHVALVERGRCGTRCAIADRAPFPSSPQQRSTAMEFWNKLRVGASVADSCPCRSGNRDDALSGAEAAGGGREETLAALVSLMEARLDDLDARLQRLEQEREAGSATADATPEAWRDLLAQAEILAPGRPLPVGEGLPACRRAALDAALSMTPTARALAGMIGDPGAVRARLPEMADPAVTSLFQAAAARLRQDNNARLSAFPAAASHSAAATAAVPTPAGLNAAARAFWSGRA